MAEHPNEEQRTLILTGASRGIGHATVKRFSSAGWRVITCSRHAFPENCPWAAGPEDHIQVDLADPEDTLRAVDEMRSRLKDGRLHALVNNAGISPKLSAAVDEGTLAADGRSAAQNAHSTRLNTLNSSMEVWRKVFEVNLFSTIWLARGLMEELAAAKGAIVNVTSIAGSRVHPFAGSAYATSKAALAALIAPPTSFRFRWASAGSAAHIRKNNVPTSPALRPSRTAAVKSFSSGTPSTPPTGALFARCA